MAPRVNYVPSHAIAFKPVSAHTSYEDAKLALHSYDAFVYVSAYNYGSSGRGTVYRCDSHKACTLRLRILETTRDEAEIPVIFQLAVAGEHGTQVINKDKKRKGIDLCIKGEVDALLAAGVNVKTCLRTLQQRYQDQPDMLAKVPDKSKLTNRLATLTKLGWKMPEAGLNSDADVIQPLVRPARRKRQKRYETVDESSEGLNSGSEYEEETRRHDAVEVEEEEQFDKDKMMQEFTALPGRPIWWSIFKKTRYIEDKSEDIVTQWITGQVIGWKTGVDTPTKWMVRFTDGEKRDFELEELVNEI
ncbi:Multiple inositol polyphosphate phosphatase, partial [Phytophthora megakarya]